MNIPMNLHLLSFDYRDHVLNGHDDPRPFVLRTGVGHHRTLAACIRGYRTAAPVRDAAAGRNPSGIRHRAILRITDADYDAVAHACTDGWAIV